MTDTKARGRECTRVIERAWQITRARREAFIGPEPIKPSRWNVLAWLIYSTRHAAWRERVQKCNFMTPTQDDLMQAADELGADIDTRIELIRAHERALAARVAEIRRSRRGRR